jgi:hypothetical protein
MAPTVKDNAGEQKRLVPLVDLVRIPILDTCLLIDYFFRPDFPADFARERKPQVVVMAIVGEPTTLRRHRQSVRRCRG